MVVWMGGWVGDKGEIEVIMNDNGSFGFCSRDGWMGRWMGGCVVAWVRV